MMQRGQDLERGCVRERQPQRVACLKSGVFEDYCFEKAANQIRAIARLRN